MVDQKRIETYLTGEPADIGGGQARLLLRCEVRLGPGHSEEWLITAGPDDSGERMALWQQTEWSSEGPDAVAWTDRCRYPEPEVWTRLLEAYLRARQQSERFDGSEFTNLRAPARGMITLTQVRAVFGKVFG